MRFAPRVLAALSAAVSALPLGSDRLEAALMVHVAAEDLLALCGVHAWAIGRMAKPL